MYLSITVTQLQCFIPFAKVPDEPKKVLTSY